MFPSTQGEWVGRRWSQRLALPLHRVIESTPRMASISYTSTTPSNCRELASFPGFVLSLERVRVLCVKNQGRREGGFQGFLETPSRQKAQKITAEKSQVDRSS